MDKELLQIEFDTRVLEEWALALRRFPERAEKKMVNCLNDMAFYYRDAVIAVFRRRYTVRDEKFLKRVFVVEKASKEKMYAKAGSIEYPRFSGFTEELGLGSTSKKYRVITRWGRKGQSPRGIAEGWARLHKTGPGGDAPTGEDGKGGRNDMPSIFSMRVPMRQAFAAMLAMTASGRLKTPKNNQQFIAGRGPSGYGIFRMSKPLPSMKGMKRKDWDRARYDAVQSGLHKIQQFRDTPVEPSQRFDWREEAAEDLRDEYSEEYIFKKYIAPVVLGLKTKTGNNFN